MRAVLDANVLFPTVLREVLTGAAGLGLFTPLWSGRILGEWVHATHKLGASQPQRAGAEAALLRLRFPDAEVQPPDEAGLALDLPDPGDLHVLACAMAGGADVIVTMNLRDFPRHALAPLGLRALHPDAWLTDLVRDHPAALAQTVQMVLDRTIMAGGDLTRTQLLKRAGLPRLNKALTRAMNGAGSGAGSGDGAETGTETGDKTGAGAGDPLWAGKNMEGPR